MTTVLVVDDEPDTRTYVRRMAPEDWTVLEAGDTDAGLDLVRKHLGRLKLIVLDLDLKGGGDGRVLCARIRELSLSLPILPFTGKDDQLSAMEVMGCLPPITKPIRPNELAERLRSALDQEVTMKEANPLMRVIREQCAAMEKQLRHSPEVVRVAVYASSPLKRGGLMRVLATAATPVEAISPAALREMLHEMRWTALVVDAEDGAKVRSLAGKHGVPLILIASPTTSMRGLDWPEVVAVIEEDPLMSVRLAETLDALAAGRPVEWETGKEQVAGDVLVPPAVARCLADAQLPPRLVELLWLDHEGLNTKRIAVRMGVTADTISGYWKRVCESLDRYSRDEARAWARARLAAQNEEQ